MNFISPSPNEVVKLKFARDRTRLIKQGYPWIFRDWIVDAPPAKAGSRASVRDRDGSLLAFGMYDPESPLTVRVCATEREQLGDELIASRLEAALNLRRMLFDRQTTGFRLLNGEGDGLPGLVCDVYGSRAVLQTDGNSPAGFWKLPSIAEWLKETAGATSVFLKFRSGEKQRAKLLLGDDENPCSKFLENGVHFEADNFAGQKTGFFFDQRENRARIRALSAGRSVLNLFSYTGGFSVYAGLGKAKRVTSIDISKPAIAAAERNWDLNGLAAKNHQAEAADVFEFLETSQRAKKKWDLVIVDPPSFASSEKLVEKATASYQALFTAAMSVLTPSGLLAVSSCSSHIALPAFLEITRAAFSKAKRKGVVLGVYGQPADHPFPLVCPELQYLKFLVTKVT